MKTKIGLVGILLTIFIVGMSATGVKTYLYNPQNPQSEITQIYIDTDGKIYSKNTSGTLVRMDSNYILPAATTTVRGGVNCGIGLVMSNDSIGVALHGITGISISNDTISDVLTAGVGLTRTTNDFALDLMSSSARGGAKTGIGLSMNGDSIGVALHGGTGITVSNDTITGAYTGGTGLTLTDADFALDLMTADARGGAKAGAYLSMTGDSVGVDLTAVQVAFPAATNSARGVVKAGYGLIMTGDSIGFKISADRLAFTKGDATPSVAGRCYFITAIDTTIVFTNFDGAADGQLITIRGTGGKDTVRFGTYLKGSATDIVLDTNDVARFIYDSTTAVWYLVGKIDASANNGF